MATAGIRRILLAMLLVGLGLSGSSEPFAAPIKNGLRAVRSLDKPAGTAQRAVPLERSERILIHTSRPYTRLIAAIEAGGGRVLRQYAHFEGLAAEIPRAALPSLVALVGPHRISRDLSFTAPTPENSRIQPFQAALGNPALLKIPYSEMQALSREEVRSLATFRPDSYIVNNAFTRASTLHAEGIDGTGVVVAVVDTGIRPGFEHLENDGSVIGGEDFVGDGLGYSHPDNSGHGTFVAGLISGNVILTVPTALPFFESVQTHIPEAIVPPNGVALLGSAPAASLYVLRVLGPLGGGTASDILAAVDRAIELREMFEAGDPNGVDIQVVNMSLGGPTLHAGRDLVDSAVNALLDHDILLVASAGNAGPSSMTIGSPGTSFSALTVGAASLPHNEWIVWDVLSGLGQGRLLRPFDGIQVPLFSSRGPTADGRGTPDLVTNGDWVLGLGFFGPDEVSVGAGTSFAAPTAAGVAALLRQAFPEATARQIRRALIETANPEKLPDYFTPLDRGAGYLDAAAARDLLTTGTVPDTLASPPGVTRNVKANLEGQAGLIIQSGKVLEHSGPLEPAERSEIFYDVKPNTSSVSVTLSNIVPTLPPEEQNQIFGDRVLLTVHSSKTSAHNVAGDYVVGLFDFEDTVVIRDPEPGLLRVTLLGGWINVGTISADIAIESESSPRPILTAKGKIREGEEAALEFTMPPGVSRAEFRVSWAQDWSRYPLNNIDLLVIDPEEKISLRGLTLSNPEKVEWLDPLPGLWQVLVGGIGFQTDVDKFELQVALDGQVLNASGQLVNPGGTQDDERILFLGDNNFVEVPLEGFDFPFQGTTWNSVFVNSNGSLTFGIGDADSEESLEKFLTGPPRIALLWDDLDLSNGGRVYLQNGPGSVTVKYDQAPINLFGSNTLSVTLTHKGDIIFDYEEMEVLEINGIVGVTQGSLAGPVDPSDLSTLETHPGPGTVYEYFCGLIVCTESGTGVPIPFNEFDLAHRSLRFEGFEKNPPQ